MGTVALVLAALAALAVVLAALVAGGGARVDRDHRRLAEAAWRGAAGAPEAPFDPAALEGLPAPIQRYLRRVVTPGRRPLRRARYAQEGELQMGLGEAGWRPFTAVQTVTAAPPAFVWDATVAMAPAVKARVVDGYGAEGGVLRARVLGLLTVANPPRGPSLDEGELLRWLAEAPWYPTVLLPGHGVRWEALDDTSARATVTHRGVRATLTFHVDAAGEVVRVASDGRPRVEPGGEARRPWSGAFSDYEEHGGLRVPTRAVVTWHLPDGDHDYFRGRTVPEVLDPPA